MSRTRPSVTKPTTPRFLRHADHQIAGDRGLGEAVGGGDEDVAGPGDGEGPEQSEIVGRAVVAGDRNADHRPRRGRERLDAIIERAAPVHGVDDIAGQRAGEGGNVLLRAGAGSRVEW